MEWLGALVGLSAGIIRSRSPASSSPASCRCRHVTRIGRQPAAWSPAVAPAVALEGAPRTVRREAVELDDHALHAPEEVGHEGVRPHLQERVDLGLRQVQLPEEGAEGGLELLARDPSPEAAVGEDRSQRVPRRPG